MIFSFSSFTTNTCAFHRGFLSDKLLLFIYFLSIQSSASIDFLMFRHAVGIDNLCTEHQVQFKFFVKHTLLVLASDAKRFQIDWLFQLSALFVKRRERKPVVLITMHWELNSHSCCEVLSSYRANTRNIQPIWLFKNGCLLFFLSLCSDFELNI